MVKKGSYSTGMVFVYLVLIIASIFSLFPFFWIIIGSTNTSTNVIQGKLTIGNQWIVNLQKLFVDSNMGGALWNSVKIAAVTVVLTLLFTSMAAYGFQMYKSKGKTRVYSFFLLTMMVPFASLMVPLFKLIATLNLINSVWAIILVSSASVFMVFFFRQSFVNYPTDVLEAARVDGANELKTFFRIFVPSMKGTYAAAAIYTFMTSWNNYLWPLIVLQTNDQQTTTLLISSLSSAYNPDYGVIMSGIAIVTLPVIIIFFAFQRQFVEGMLGSVKQ